MSKVNEIVTTKIIESLNKGVVPWHKPWATANPQNLVSRRDYRGINHLLLSLCDYETPYFVTFKQAQQLGGSVKEGEKASLAVFWTMLDSAKLGKGKVKGKKNKSEEIDQDVAATSSKIPLLRYYNIFNVSQTTIPEEKIPTLNRIEKFRDNDEIEKFVADLVKSGKIPNIEYNSSKAYYAPTEDKISLPNRKQFSTEDEYYSTLFHEIIHSTGNIKRLKRLKKINRNEEELVAEIGCAFLCNMFGVTSCFDNSISYIKSWLDALKDDNNLIISSSSKAQKALDYLLGEEHNGNTEDIKEEFN